MKPAMIEALYRISLLSSPDPDTVFQHIVREIAEIYGDTMAMVNVLDGDCLRFRTTINSHSSMKSIDTLELRHTLCQFPLKSANPLLIQNAREHPDFCHHLVIQLNLKRYLGVPVCSSAGNPVGTLCFLDDQTDEPLGDEDIRFLSLLAMRVSAELDREQLIQHRIAWVEEKAQAKRAFLEEASRFKAFVDSTADAIISFDREGLMTTWNGGAERIFGYTAQEAIGQSYTLIGTQEVYSFQHQVFFETLQGDTHQWYETRRKRKDGTMIDVSITTSPLMLDGESIGLVAIVRDITEKVRAAKQLKERNAQLDVLAQEQRVIAQRLADANSELKAKAEEKRQFVNMVIHDLRHLLTSIRTTLYLLRIERSQKQRLQDLKALENRTQALGTLLDELVLYDQIEAGRSHLKIEPIDVSPFISACIEEVAAHQEAQAVPVRCEIARELGTVYLDGGKLRHILLNLVANALKFTREGHITVRARPENADQWRIEVEDTGIGMTASERVRAFEEYFSGSNREYGGAGLGLAIAHRLCTSLNAQVTLHSVTGQGTCFQLVFPRRLAACEDCATDDEARNP